MNNSRKGKKIYLAIFIFMALSAGWFGVLLDKALEEQPTGETLGMTVLLTLPLFTVIVIRFFSRDWSDFGVKPRFKGNLKWYLFAIAVFPIITILLVGISWYFNLVEFTNFKTDVFFSLAIASFFPAIIINIFEEFSWRGYLTPKLSELNINDWLLYLIVGLVWGLWHAAYYLFLLPSEYFEIISRVEYVFVGVIVMVCWSIMFVELYRVTGSVWPVVLMHAIQDSFPNLLINNIDDGGVITFTKTADLWLNPTTGIITALIIIAIGLWLRSVRLKKERLESKDVELKLTN